MDGDNKTYEEAMSEMEQIVASLEGGELPLERAIEAYEKGVALSKRLESLLGEAKRRVSLLTPDGNEISFGEEDGLEDI